MPGQRTGRELIPGIRAPGERVHQRPQCQSGIRHSSSDYDVGIPIERLRDRDGSQVEIGCNDVSYVVQYFSVNLARGEFAWRQKVSQVVAFDNRDARNRNTKFLRQRQDAFRRSSRVGRAEVSNDPNLLIEAAGQHWGKKAVKCGAEAALWVAPALKLRERKRALGQCLEHQEAWTVAGRKGFDHRTGGIRPVACKAGAHADECFGAMHSSFRSWQRR
jgi:hypothetical protein